jgi:hypothetical protein
MSLVSWLTPWNPATMTTLPSSRAERTRPGVMSTMRALPCTASVMIPACEPVNDFAGTPRSCSAIASSDMEMRSPAVSRMSSSRSGGRSLIRAAIVTRSSVVLPMAETTTTVWLPSRWVRATRSATGTLHAIDVADRGPAVLLDHDAHGRFRLLEGT